MSDLNPIHQIIDHTTTPSFSFAFSDFLKREYRFGLDPNRPVCKAFLQGHCPAGNSCPDRHATNTSFSRSVDIHPTPLCVPSFYLNKPPPSSLVCKHWLRGLCKKGDACEFLHEYNLYVFLPSIHCICSFLLTQIANSRPPPFPRLTLSSRKMPECNSFSRTRYCPNGDECLYLHIDPDSRLPPCPHYDKGFCPLGPRCSKRHVRKTLCPYYLAGFCPDGKQCKEGAHPKWPKDLPPPTVRVKRDPAEVEREMVAIREEMERNEEREREKGFPGRRDWGGTPAGGNVAGGRGRNRGQRNRRGY